MKICDNCGAYNSDKRKLCVDCGETLGDKISEREEQQIRQNIGAKIEKMYNKKDPLYVSTFDKLVGAVSIIGIILCVVFTVKNYSNHKSSEYLLWAIFYFALSGFEAFVPKLSWCIEQIRLSRYVEDADNIRPSVLYFYSRKLFIIVAAVNGIVSVVVNFL